MFRWVLSLAITSATPFSRSPLLPSYPPPSSSLKEQWEDWVPFE
ncbi:MAG: hypothetical protein ACKESB_00690 [Candidatus Hodgkinia cicadicola]